MALKNRDSGIKSRTKAYWPFLTFQIEDLRSSCQALIGEKASLLKTLSTVSALSSESTLSEVDRGELVTTSERLKFRLESVNIELVVKR